MSLMAQLVQDVWFDLHARLFRVVAGLSHCIKSQRSLCVAERVCSLFVIFVNRAPSSIEFILEWERCDWGCGYQTDRAVCIAKAT